MFYDLVLLDSGYEINDRKSNVDIYVRNGDLWEQTDNDTDDVGHGGAVMNLAIEGIDNVRAAVFKSFTDVVMSNIDNIVSALEYVYNNIECRYIQMSFGVRAYSQPLYEILSKLYNEKNVLIIAAFDNCGAMSFPAALDFVIGVSGNPYIKDKNTLIACDTGLIDIYARNGKQLVAAKSSNGRRVEEGNSFATSHVTNKLLRSGRNFANKDEAMLFFDSRYKGPVKAERSSVNGTRAVLYPLNKEMYSLVNYADSLTVDLVGVYDIKYSGNLGRELKSFSGKKSYTVKNIDRCDWDSFDTMILGHQRELSYILGYDSKKKMLDLCLEHGKNVFCYDRFLAEEYEPEFRKRSLVFICADNFRRTPREGRLYQIQTPILCVLGTNKKQGKFTLQMQIKRILESKGIDLAVLGTEPNAELMGCAETLVIGYDAELGSKTGDEIIESFNEKIHLLDKKNHDLILVGGQSGFFPHLMYNTGHININQIAFLYGIMPDGVILSFSCEDEPEYIKKSIAAIEALSKAKVIMLALYAFRTEYDYVINSSKVRLTEEEISEIKKKMTDEIGRPVVVSGDFAEDDRIFDTIIEYYCK
ncbi:MAG: DUF1611 domain-containing protein [Ruminococcus sp.]|nr:DUF1611 domain-containing protein [Ruminococcus sp.]